MGDGVVDVCVGATPFPVFILAFAAQSEVHTLHSLASALHKLPSLEINQPPRWQKGLILQPPLSLGRAILTWVQGDRPQGQEEEDLLFFHFLKLVPEFGLQLLMVG